MLFPIARTSGKYPDQGSKSVSIRMPIIVSQELNNGAIGHCHNDPQNF
jgi:hypothetical protein